MSSASTGNLDKLMMGVEPRITSSSHCYEEKNGILVWNRNKDTQTPLCNFTARITSEEIHDDGAEKKMAFVIEGKTSGGKALPSAEISSEKYAGMTWVNASWGTRAIVCAGPAVKDHLRVAIQTLSGEVVQRTVYAHLGWRKLSGRWVYLHAGGAISEKGADNSINVSPHDDRIKSYLLPTPSSGDELRESIHASLSLLNLAPIRISAPLLAGIYRAPLGESCGIDFSLFLSGSSGCQKSECSAMAQAHFGKDFSRLNLPGNWASTGNSLERQAFLVKDGVFTVDDFAPTGSATDVARLNKEADRLLRGQGNKAGRGRLTSDAKARPQYFPRGIIISSGEDIPRGPSLRARTLILEMCRGDVKLDCLTAMQGHAAAGTLSKAMAGYVQWLAPQIDQLKITLPARHLQLRAQINLGASHSRTPDLVISLGLGLECFLQYALHSEAISISEKEELWNKCWSALQEAGSQQMEHQSGEDATSKFFEMIRSAFVSGRAHLADVRTGINPPQAERWGWQPERMTILPSGNEEPGYWNPKGDKIGWIDGQELLLSPGPAYTVAQKISREQNDSIPVTAPTLWRRLAQKGLITKNDPKKNLSKRLVEGQRQYVLIIPDKQTIFIDGLYTPKTRGDRDSRDTASPSADLRPQNAPLELGHLENQGRKIGAESPDNQASDPIVPEVPKNTTPYAHCIEEAYP